MRLVPRRAPVPRRPVEKNNHVVIRGIAMTIRRILQVLAVTVIAMAGGLSTQTRAGQTVDFGPAPPPLSRPSANKLMANPAYLSATKKNWSQGSSAIAPAPLPDAAPPPLGGTWTSGNRPSGNPILSNPLLLTDGTVISHVSCSGTWWRLTPDSSGSYVNGTWSAIASLPSGYTPRFFGSAVLTDGKVVVEGGEYNSGCAAQWTNLGAIYDPAANTWTSISPPSGWTTIGDAQAIVLTNGTYMQANCCTTLAALLNEGSLSWSSTGSGKHDSYDEEGWTLLPSGKLLTVDAYVYTTCGQGSEIYDPSTGAWSSAGNVGIQLADCANPGNNPSYEMGPQILRPDGTVVAFGGTLCSDGANSSCASGTLSTTTYTGIYNSSAGTWSVGPAIPAVSGRNYSLADAPAALLPNGSILFAASPNYQGFVAPTHFFEFSPSNTIGQVADPTDYASFTSFQWNFLVLPTGQIMAVETDGSNVWYYNPSGTYSSSWQPVISSLSSSTLSAGGTYQINGTQLNGLSQGAAYGDDAQAATNYPIVRITNNGTGHVFFARTSGFSTTSVASGQASTANFRVPLGIESGASTLVAIANGIPSSPVSVTVGGNNTYTLTVSVNGNPGGTVTSSPSGINCGSTCSKSFNAGTQVTLSATPDTAWGFFGWGSSCSGIANTCTVTVNGNMSVSATFGTLFGAEQMAGSAILPAPVITPYPQPPFAY
jgi:hypothetical protein